MKEVLQTYASYNLWANELCVEMILKLDEKKLDEEVKSSFPSLRKTIYHIWDAEQIWLSRMQGDNPTDWPSKGVSDSGFTAFLKGSGALTEYVTGLDESGLASECSFTNLAGDEHRSRTYWGILMHVFNHGSFHRGQLITMMRQMGFTDFPGTDMVLFLGEELD